MTTKIKLFKQIQEWLPETVDDINSKNCVELIGTIVDSFTLTLGKDIPNDEVIAKILKLNGLKIYSITGHVHFPNGAPDKLITEISGQKGNLVQQPTVDTTSSKKNPSILPIYDKVNN